MLLKGKHSQEDIETKYCNTRWWISTIHLQIKMGKRISTFVWNSISYRSLIVILLHFVTSVVTQDTDVTSWTFNIPNVSFLSFSPVITKSQNQHISLSFRTRNPNGLLFCHYLKDLDVKELNKINYKICAELKYGLFNLDYRIRQYQEDGLTLGVGMFLFIFIQFIFIHLTKYGSVFSSDWQSQLRPHDRYLSSCAAIQGSLSSSIQNSDKKSLCSHPKVKVGHFDLYYMVQRFLLILCLNMVYYYLSRFTIY